MRVISGLRKGHKLKAPQGGEVRPTEDRIKESLFNILRDIDNDSIVLDLFAGSGAVGIEFLSRGAKSCYFVDILSHAILTIKNNLSATNFLEKGIILNKDYKLALNYLKNNNIDFDYIFLDPPFRKEGFLNEILETIDNSKILAPNGIIIIEHEKELNMDDNIFGFKKTDCRKYGSKSISFYKMYI